MEASTSGFRESRYRPTNDKDPFFIAARYRCDSQSLFPLLSSTLAIQRFECASSEVSMTRERNKISETSRRLRLRLDLPFICMILLVKPDTNKKTPGRSCAFGSRASSPTATSRSAEVTPITEYIDLVAPPFSIPHLSLPQPSTILQNKRPRTHHEYLQHLYRLRHHPYPPPPNQRPSCPGSPP